MEKIKSFFSRFKDKRGDFGATLALVTVICVAVGLYTVGEYSEGAREKVQKPYTTMDNLPDPDKVDTGEEYLKGKKVLVETVKKLGEDALGLGLDETGGIGILKKTGVYDLRKKEEKEAKEDKKEDQKDNTISEDNAILIDGLKGAVEGGAEDLSIEEKLDENN
ncbi:MAG: hypothetical protein MUP02_02030, partial [Actinobacteria bacterium]|nr:hypothetical protein [Actinomycetota bacterium]